MQLISHKLEILSLIIYTIAIASNIVVRCAPTEPPETSDLEKASEHELAALTAGDTATTLGHKKYHQHHQANSKSPRDLDYDYLYKFRHLVYAGSQKALDECREKFKWDRFNCPLKVFKSIIIPDEGSNPMPSNKEMGLIRALISSSVVLSIVRTCSLGSNSLCSCSNPLVMPEESAKRFMATGEITNATPTTQPSLIGTIEPHSLGLDSASNHFKSNMLPASFDETTLSSINNNNYPANIVGRHRSAQPYENDNEERSLVAAQTAPNLLAAGLGYKNNNKFEWAGCEEVVKLGFEIARHYLKLHGNEASRCINKHNFEAGRQALRRKMRRRCQCQGPSGACQMRTCWTVLPDMSEVSDYLIRQYRSSAKVGASTASETDAGSLAKELGSIGKDKLVFADASPDYCYENEQLGINGTLGRYCSKTKHRNGTEVSRNERDSCDRLCTKCGYKTKREEIIEEDQCQCRFKFCCSIECKRCSVTRERFKCVRHS